MNGAAVLCSLALLVHLALLAACSSDSDDADRLDTGVESDHTVERTDDSVTLHLYGPSFEGSAFGEVLFSGRYSNLVPIENPLSALGTKHEDDPVAQGRIADYETVSDAATQLVVYRGTPQGSPDVEPLYELSGCVPNESILAELDRLGGSICDPSDLGRSIAFANLQLARIAPNGPYHIYEDYAIQTLPLFLDTGGCLGGAWLCEGDESDFDGIFIPSYPSHNEMLKVSSATSTSGPGGEYGDATYSDLRLGGVEIIVRNLLDTDPLTPDVTP